jgi:hypothetical protein
VKNKEMKTKTIKINGTVLVLVITTMALISIILLFLSSASSTMMFQANNVYLQACEKNLISSGLSWAKTNMQKGNISVFNETIQLDVTEMNIPHSNLDVTISSPKDEQHEAQIKTSCNRARLNLTSSETYTFE